MEPKYNNGKGWIEENTHEDLSKCFTKCEHE